MTSTFPFFKAGLFIAGAAAVVLLTGAPVANAGECPAAKVTADGQKAGATAHKDVTEKLLGQIDLSKEKISIADHHLRMRRLDIKPGGEVAKAMAKEKIFIGRVWPAWPDHVRVSIGTMDEMAKFKTALVKVMA